MPFSSPAPPPCPKSRLLRELSVGACARVCARVVACDEGTVTLDDGTARVDALLPPLAPPSLDFLKPYCPPPAAGQTLECVGVVERAGDERARARLRASSFGVVRDPHRLTMHALQCARAGAAPAPAAPARQGRERARGADGDLSLRHLEPARIRAHRACRT